MAKMHLLLVEEDILYYLMKFLLRKDALSLSATCSRLRHVLRPSLFATCPWPENLRKAINAPPESAWGAIRHLYVQTDEDEADMQYFLVTHDLSRLESLHVRATRINRNLALILRSTLRIHTLDLAYLYFRTFPKNIAVSMDYPLQPLPRFPQLVSRPRVVRYCSRLDLVHEVSTERDWIEKARATRYPFATLLHELDISQVEEYGCYSVRKMSEDKNHRYRSGNLKFMVAGGSASKRTSEPRAAGSRLRTANGAS